MGHYAHCVRCHGSWVMGHGKLKFFNRLPMLPTFLFGSPMYTNTLMTASHRRAQDREHREPLSPPHPFLSEGVYLFGDGGVVRKDAVEKSLIEPVHVAVGKGADTGGSVFV